MKKNPRMAGVFLVVAGFGMAVFFWDHALKLAQAHADHIQGVDAVLIGVIFGTMGLLVLFGGEKFNAQIAEFRHRRKNWKDFVVFAVLILPGFLARLWLQSILTGYGYTF